MSGVDTIRGITYQHACVIAASIDVVENPHFASIRVESSDDIVDFDITNVNMSPIRVAQVKTRTEPHTFSPADLIATIKKWGALGNASVEAYELISDAQLSQTAHVLIALPLEALDKEDHRATALAQLQRVGLESVPEQVLSRVRFRMRSGDIGTVLESAEYRVLRLAELSGPATSEQSVSGVDRLFRAISVRGGSKHAIKRSFTRLELATILGLDLRAIDSGRSWTRELANALRDSVLSAPPSSGLFLQLAKSPSAHPALRLNQLSLRDDEQRRIYAADELMDNFSRCAIAGIAGAGKSTTLELLAFEVARDGGLPVLVSPAQYLSGSLGRLIRETLERASNARLVPGASDVALSDESCVLLIDGFTERPIDQTNQLRRDLIDILNAIPKLRVLVSGRRHEGFRLPGVPILELQGLDERQREALSRLLLPTGDNASLVQSVTQSLGDLAANPLLFTMALSLGSGGNDRSTRPALYGAIVEGLWARLPDEDDPELAEEVLTRIARQLVDRGQFRTSNRSWREMTVAILNALSSEGQFVVDGRTAEEVVQSATRAGLIRTLPFVRETVFLHDSFRDYFAARSYNSRLGLPERLTIDHETSIEFLCETVGLSGELALKAAAENPVLFVKLSQKERSRSGHYDWELARQALSLLVHEHLGHEVDVISTIGLRIHWTPTRSWLAITDTGTAMEVADPSMAMAEPGIWRAFSLDGRHGPLRLVSTAWLTIVEEAIQASTCGVTPWSRTFGLHPSELVKAVMASAEARKQSLSHISERVLPTVSDRLLTIAGPMGLRAIIASDTMRASGEHLMHYRYEDGPHSVGLAETLDDGQGRTALNSQTSAETYIEHYGETHAVDELLKATRRLFGVERA